jgi:hypothetical protein
MEWDSFRAARAALAGVVSVSRARDVAATITASVPDYHSQLAAHLSKGHLTVNKLPIEPIRISMAVED